MKNPYETLGVNPDATVDEIKKAYKRLAQQLHPDKNNGDEDAHRLFVETSKAYNILIDPVKRKQYDETGDAEMVDLISKAQTAIAHGVNSYIRTAIEDNGIVPTLRELIDNYIKELQSRRIELFKCKSKLKKLEKLKGKIKIKEFESLYSNVYESVEQELKGKIEMERNEIRVLDKVVDILNGAEEMGISSETFISYVIESQHPSNPYSKLLTEG